MKISNCLFVTIKKRSHAARSRPNFTEFHQSVAYLYRPVKAAIGSARVFNTEFSKNSVARTPIRPNVKLYKTLKSKPERSNPNDDGLRTTTTNQNRYFSNICWAPNMIKYR
jgi:hypothetical protein